MDDQMIIKLSLPKVLRHQRSVKRVVREKCNYIEKCFKKRQLYPALNELIVGNDIIMQVLDNQYNAESVFVDFADLDETECLIARANDATHAVTNFSRLYKGVDASIMSDSDQYVATLSFTQWLLKQYQNLLTLGIPIRNAILKRMVVVHDSGIDNFKGVTVLHYRDYGGSKHTKLYRYSRQWRCQQQAKAGTVGEHDVVLTDIDQLPHENKPVSPIYINSDTPAALNETVKYLAERQLKIKLLAQAGYSDPNQYVY